MQDRAFNRPSKRVAKAVDGHAATTIPVHVKADGRQAITPAGRAESGEAVR